jgi:hypothetical protein
VDLDGNGLLSREEFNLFNWRTSGEQVFQTKPNQTKLVIEIVFVPGITA